MPGPKKGAAARPLSDKAADAANPALAAVDADEMGRVRPEGLPALWPLHALPRRDRTAVKRALHAVQTTLETLREKMDALRAELPADAEDEVMTPSQRARANAIMTDMEDAGSDALDVMAMTASDKEAFETWADKLEEQDVFDAFAWFGRHLSPGEATGSQTF